MANRVLIGGAIALAWATSAGCAIIAGLDDPADAPPADASADVDVVDATANLDGAGDGGTSDADAGRACTGPKLKADTFEDRADASAGWTLDSRGDGGVIEVVGGRLHVRVPAAAAGVNVRRNLVVEKAAPKHICIAFSVQVTKPVDTTAYGANADSTFGFVHAPSADGGVDYYYGIAIGAQGVIAYILRDGAANVRRPLAIPLATKWNVFMDADFVADRVTIAVNDREDTFPMIRPPDSPLSVIYVGIRNLGPTPEAEAFFDDVTVTAD